MDRMLRIGKDLEIPVDAATQAIGIVASRGAGKTYCAAVLAEELIGAGVPVVALDPLGVLWGLRASADGKGAGLAVIILGGEHGDVPLEPGAGKVIAEWVVAERRSAVLDLSAFRKGEQRQFVTDFAEHLYRANREPLHLILDESDLFAPQRPMPGEQRMLGAVEDLVRRGRARGIGITLVTQRPAVVAKDVLTQVSVLVAMRMLGPQDRDAVDAWIKFHGSEKERRQVLESLPSLPIGTAWFWSPGWLGLLRKVEVRRRKTFDSSSTPRLGAKRIAPRQLAPVELDVLKTRIAATIERAKAEDPRALRARIAELERTARNVQSVKPAKPTPPERIEVPVVDREGMAATTANLQKLGALIAELVAAHRLAVATNAAVEKRLRSAAALGERVSRKGAALPTKSAAALIAEHDNLDIVAHARQPLNGVAVAGAEKLAGGERKILAVLAQHGECSKSKLAVIAGYARGGGGFLNYLSALRCRGHIEGSNGGTLRLTAEGASALGPVDPLPTGRDLIDHWCARLGRAERLVLKHLAERYPGKDSKDGVAVATGYAAGGGGFLNALSKLRTLGLIEGRNELAISEEVFS